MKLFKTITIFLFFSSFILISLSFQENSVASMQVNTQTQRDSVLRHVVLFKFKENTPVKTIKEIENAFNALPSKIKEIRSYEWGINNSPEGLDKGFTHCFFLTFNSEKDRAIYLPHPDHKAFGTLLTPYLEDVLVLDYWSN